jgi:hypothetical protein
MTGDRANTRGINMNNCFSPAFFLATLLTALVALPVGVSAGESPAVFQELDGGLG